MSIREWWGERDIENPTLTDVAMDKLLLLYSIGLCSYFLNDINSVNKIDDLMESIMESQKNDVRPYFIDWLQEKGLPYIRYLVQHSFPDNRDLIAELHFECFVLEDELRDFHDPGDLRSCLINIVSYMPDRIKHAFG